MPRLPEKTGMVAEGSGKRVLIVDDVENNIRVVEAVLENFDLQIDTASSGAEAIAKARACRPDIVVMDIAMPHMTGFDAARSINDFYNEDPVDVIALTADVTPENIAKVERAPFRAFLRKPINVAEFQSIIRELIAAGPTVIEFGEGSHAD